MSCTKELTFVAAAPTGDFPLEYAVYVGDTDKIYGMMGPYVVQFNATTGAPESWERVSSPAQGPCGICYHAPTGKLYASVWLGHSGTWYTATRPERDIFPIDPATLAVGGGLGVYGRGGSAFGSEGQGPEFMLSDGTQYIYYAWHWYAGGTFIGRVDPSAPASWASDFDYGDDDMDFIQFCFDGTLLHFPRQSYNRVAYVNPATLAEDHLHIAAPDRSILMPLSVEWCALARYTAPYVVSASKWLMRVNDYATSDYTKWDISSVTDAAPRPQRIRYCPLDEKLYLASPSTDCITIFDPVTEAVTAVKTGFDAPHDLVFTNTKIWAVQRGAVGLKEVT